MKSLILFLFLLSSAHATIRLNVTITHKKGIDKGLVLVSELHQVEEIGGEEGVSFAMKGGVKLEVEATFQEDYSFYGPSDALEITGQLYSASGKRIGELEGENAKMHIGKERLFTFSAEDQLIEIKILPLIAL